MHDDLRPWLLKLVDSPNVEPADEGLRELVGGVLREVVEIAHEVVELSVRQPDRRHRPEDITAAKDFFLVAFQEQNGDEQYYPF